MRKRIFFLSILPFISHFTFSQDSAFVLRAIRISGNVKTRERVVYREIPNRIGDTVCCPHSFSRLVYNRLTGTGLFNFVNTSVHADTLQIEVTEKFYFWPLPQLSWADRNFNVWWQTKDLSRLIYGVSLFHDNVAGLHHEAFASLIWGYNHIAEAGYYLPFRKYNSGWAFGGHAYYWTNHELWYKTENNRLSFLRLDERRIQENAGASIQERKRFNYFARLEFTQGWWQLRIDSFALKANPEYTLGDTAQRELFAMVEYVNDHRDKRDYPSSGYLIRGGMKFGSIKSIHIPVSDHKESQGYSSFFLRASHFNKLLRRTDLVFAKAMAMRYIAASLPYNYTRQLGYGSDYVRGYEPYVSDGRGFVLIKTGLRKAILNNRLIQLPTPRFLRNYKKVPLSIWFNIFADAGRVLLPSVGVSNDLNTQWQIGTGVGLDFIAWYNGLIRTEYSFNRMGEGYFNLSYRNAF